MGYEVRIASAAEREMDKLPTAVHKRISRRILALEDNPRLRGAKKLSGREDNGISIVYTRGSCDNPDLTLVRKRVYLLRMIIKALG